MKTQDWLSERMVFGLLIIVGFIAILHELLWKGPTLKPEVISLVSGGVGVLGAAIGIITQAIWKTDKIDKQAADTAAVLAAKAPDLSTTTTVAIAPVAPVAAPVAPSGPTPAPGQGV
jgi:hypothetical protein